MPDTTAQNPGLIGLLMKLYRRSPLHSAAMGKFLAGILARVLVARNPIAIKQIGSVTFELDLREVIDSSLYFSGTFEEDVEQMIERQLKPGMCALDIGANIGYHTFRMAALVGPGGHVHAIEPTEWAYRKLLRNASLNPAHANITFSKLALGHTNAGTVQMQFQSSYRLDNQRQSTVEDIELMTLDTYLEREKVTTLDFIKLDVDGFEGRVIQGAANSLARMKPFLLMEVNPSAMIANGDDPDQLIRVLTQARYRFATVSGRDIPDLAAYCRETVNASTMIICIPDKP